jgi:hypothetical protein
MDRYKIDQLKKGKEAAEKYFPQLSENKISGAGYKADQLKKGEEAALRHFPQLSGGATPPVSKSRNLMDEYQIWKRRKEERERMFPSFEKTVSKQTEAQKMIADYEKTHKNRNQTISAGKKVYESIPITYGKGELTRKRKHATIIPQADPEYEKYVEKGAKDPLVGMGDTKLQSFVRTALDRQPMEEMSQEEKGNYNYVLGKYGRRTADEYLKSLEERLNKQWMDKEKEKTREFSKEHPLLGTAMDAIAPMVAYEPYIAGVAAQVTGSDLDLNHPVFAPVMGEESIREGVKDAVGRGPVKDFLVDTGLSMAQSLGRIPLGPAAGGLSAGLSAASSGYVDARERGGTEGQALLQGAAQGAAESLGESLSLGSLGKFKQDPGKGVKNFLINVAKQAAVEGSEEGATEILNTISDRFIMGEKSNYNQAYQYYKNQGMSETEAKKAARIDAGKNIGLSALGGALSGGILSAGVQAVGNHTRANETTQENQKTKPDPTSIPAQQEPTQREEANQTLTQPEYRQQEEEIVTPALSEPMQQAQKYTLDTAAETIMERTGRELEENFSDLEENGRKAATEQYDGAIEMPEYRKAFNRYYDVGRYGLLPEYTQDSAYSSLLTTEQKQAALNAGILDRENEQHRNTQYIQGAAKTGSLINNAGNATEGQKRLAETLGKKTGLTFVLEERTDNSEGTYKQGEIRISTNSENFMQTTTHELTHFLKDYAPKEYQVYKKLVVAALAESNSEELESTIERYERHYKNLSREDLIEEIAADATGEFLNDEEFIGKVIKKDRSIAEKIVDFLSDMIDSIKSLISKKGTRKVAKALKEQEDFYTEARNFWLKGLETAGENYKSGQENIESLKHQLKDVDEDIDYKEILKRNKELIEINKELERQLELTKDYVPRKEDIKKVARKLLKDYNSKYSQEILEENLSNLYEYMHNSYRVDWQEVTDAATAIAKAVLNKSENMDTELTEHYKDVLQEIRTTKMRLPEADRAELEVEGGYSAFRKKYFGKIRLGNEGIDVDTAYQGLSERNPELFPESIVNPSDQILRIAEVVDSLRPQAQNPYKAEIDELSVIVGHEIFNLYRTIRALPPTKMDRMKAEMEEAIMDYDRKMENYKERLKKQYENKYATKEEYLKKTLERKEERLYSRKTKEIIIKNVTEMKRWLVEPNDKKHIPEGFRGALAEFLNCIDFSSRGTRPDGEDTNRTKLWQQTQMELQKIIASGNLDADGNYYEIDPDLVAKMEELKESVKDLDKLENLSKIQLEQLKETTYSMKKLIRNANTLHSNTRFQSVSELAEQTVKSMNLKKSRIEWKGARGIMQKLMRDEMLNPVTFFEQIGEEGRSLFEELKKGRDKQTRNIKQAADMLEELFEKNEVSRKEIESWSGDKADFTEFDYGGAKFRMTKAEIMSLYELNKRRQAQLHIYDESGRTDRKRGIRLPERMIKGKTGTRLEKNTAHIPLSRDMVEKITSTLTPKEKAVADGIAEFFQTTTTDWGNEISMDLYGYKKYKAKDYFPISVDRHQIATTTDALGRAQTIKNYGFTKSTIKGAYKPIDVLDIFDVFADRTAKMAIYNAWMPSLSDLQRWFNYNDPDVGNIKETLDRILGSNSLKYIEKLLLDINAGENAEQGATKSLLRAMKSSAVGANLRTAIQQPTAYLRAAAELDQKYLLAGLKKTESWDTIKKYAPIAQWKDWGFFDINTGKSLKSILLGTNTLQESLTEKSMWLAGKGDEITWMHLWSAVKAETKDLHPDLAPGSEEFLSKVGERFTDIIDKTQVVDSVLNRSHIMREKTIFKQMVTAFMAEPTQSFNMLYRAYFDLEQEKSPQNKKKMAKAVTVFVQTGIATSLAAALIDAMRSKEDDPYWERYKDAVGENISDNLNPMNLVPFLKDAYSIFNGWDVKRTDLQVVEEAYSLYQEIKKTVTGESKINPLSLMNKSLKVGSTAFGVPLYNLKRDMVAIMNTGLEIFGSRGKLDTVSLDTSNKDNASEFAKQALREYLKGNKAKGDAIVKKLAEEGISKQTMDRAIKNQLKDSKEANEAAEAKIEGDYETYERIVTELVENGITKAQAVSSIDSIIRKKKKEEGENEEDDGVETDSYLYKSSEIADALDAGDLDAANKIADKIFMEKTRDHVKESKIIGGIKSSLTRKYKDEYLESSLEEQRRIETLLKKIKVKGKAIYKSEDFKEWQEKKEE